jgi:CheY-like chemotaxis protein
MISAAIATQDDTEAHPPGARKVLVAEDSAITHDLLKLLLNHRGHEVDIASDGLQALQALREKTYDVALLDYHLPGMDGLEVAAAIKADAHRRRIPRLIAITADPEGLLSAEAGCESFDYILPKPLDINQLGKVVEEQAEIADRDAAAAETEIRPPAAAPGPEAKTATPVPAILEGLGYKFLMWPDDIDATRLSSRAMQATLADPRFAALVVSTPVTDADLASLWQHKALFALPVIDLTGTMGLKADLDASVLEKREKDKIERLIRRFADGRSHLHRDLLLSEDLEDRVLGRIFVAGKPLDATLDANLHACIGYQMALAPETIAREANNLYAKGLMEREFVERFHVCHRCDSSRIHVRKECVRCRSSHLIEEQYLKHFPCGFQGPKSAFRHGLQMVCPKCKRELGDHDADYEPVATLIICQNCGHADERSTTGMLCLDCEAHDNWETGRERDAYSYRLSDQGKGFAEYGRSFLGLFQKPLRFEELPQELILALNEAAKAYNDKRTPFTLVNIFYKNEREISAGHGARQFAETRDQFVDNLRAALGGGQLVVEGPSNYDFALLPNTSPAQAQRDFPRLRERAESTLRYDLGATMKAFGPEDF